MTGSTIVSLLTDVSDGILDQFGTGDVVNNAAIVYPLPDSLTDVPNDGWFLAQWGVPSPINPDTFTTDAPQAFDPIYGNALYAFPNSSSQPALAVYQNTDALGGGQVVQISDVNTNQTPSSGETDEADEFLSDNTIPSFSNMGNVINLTISLKVTQSDIQFVNPDAANALMYSNDVFSNIDLGFTLNYYGGDGIPGFSGFVQIVPWSSDGAPADYYSFPEPSNLAELHQFVSSLLLPGDDGLSALPSDPNALPVSFTFNLNNYLASTLSYELQYLTPSQKAYLEDQSNWILGGFYVGLATNNAYFIDASQNYQNVEGASISSELQVSDISLTSELGTLYNSASPVPLVPSSDYNPEISYYDPTFARYDDTDYGQADGGLYTGTLPGVDDEYLYSGYDNIAFTITNGQNWLVNPGYGNTSIEAASGSFFLQINPSDSISRQIDLISAPADIYFNAYTISPIITSQEWNDGLLSLTLSDHTTIEIAEFSPSEALIIGNQIEFDPTITYFDFSLGEEVTSPGTYYGGTLPGIFDEFNCSGTSDIYIPIVDGESWLIDINGLNSTIDAIEGTFSVRIEPSQTSRTLTFVSDPQDIYFGNYSSVPSITSQSDFGGNLEIVLSDQTTISMPGVANNPAFISDNQLFDTAPCFLTGTNISTDNGTKRVENLQIGDLILTANGCLASVKWIGYRHYCIGPLKNLDLVPVQIMAGSLGAGIPSTDLFLSSRHGIMIDNILFPAGALVNGTSIIRRFDILHISYFHVETENHEIILANGTPVETFIDMKSRIMFENAAEYEKLYPKEKLKTAPSFPRIEFGPVVECVRRRLAAICGVDLVPKTGRVVRSFVDMTSDKEIIGWAYAPDDLLIPCEVNIIGKSDEILFSSIANDFRKDVQDAGIGDGRFGFRIMLPLQLRSQDISIRLT